MRITEYLPWIIITFLTLVIVRAVSPINWPEHTRRAFHIAIAAVFFFLIGGYWLTTGEKFDETAYRLVLCRIYPFERCSYVASDVAPSAPLRKRLEEQKEQIEELKRVTEALKQQAIAQEAKRQEDERAKANAAAKPAPLPLPRHEEPQMPAKSADPKSSSIPTLRNEGNSSNEYCDQCCRTYAQPFYPLSKQAISTCLGECVSQRSSDWFGRNTILCQNGSNRRNEYCSQCCRIRAPQLRPGSPDAIRTCLKECASQESSDWFGQKAILCRF